jgi:hypothetical protein
LWDPGLLDVVALEELVLVLKLVLDASNLMVEVAMYLIFFPLVIFACYIILFLIKLNLGKWFFL